MSRQQNIFINNPNQNLRIWQQSQAYISSPAELHQAGLITGELPSICAISANLKSTSCPELTADNEQWINPNFGSPDLQVHYENIKRMVKEKTGRAMQEKERERKGKNGKIIKVAGCSPIREGVLLIRADTTLADVCKFGKECQRRWGITPLQIFLHKDEGALAERTA